MTYRDLTTERLLRISPIECCETSRMQFDQPRIRSSNRFLIRGLQVRILLGSPLKFLSPMFSITKLRFWQIGFPICQFLFR